MLPMIVFLHSFSKRHLSEHEDYYYEYLDISVQQNPLLENLPIKHDH